MDLLISFVTYVGEEKIYETEFVQRGRGTLIS